MQYHVEPAICVGREGPAEPGDHAFTRVNTWGTLWGPGQQSQWLLPLNISNNPSPASWWKARLQTAARTPEPWLESGQTPSTWPTRGSQQQVLDSGVHSSTSSPRAGAEAEPGVGSGPERLRPSPASADHMPQSQGASQPGSSGHRPALGSQTRRGQDAGGRRPHADEGAALSRTRSTYRDSACGAATYPRLLLLRWLSISIGHHSTGFRT